MKPTLVILAAGKGTRFVPLTNTTPKPMLKILNKPVMEHNLSAAQPYIDEIVIVVGYLKEKIQAYFGDNFQGIPIRYIEQTEYLGTGHAVATLKEVLHKDQFILMHGDDLYDQSFFEILAGEGQIILGKKQQNWQQFGVYQTDQQGNLLKVVEKPQEFVGDLVNIGIFKLDRAIIDTFDQIEKSIRGEYEFTDMLSVYASQSQIKVVEVGEGWLPMSYPWDILDITKRKTDQLVELHDGAAIESGVTIHGKVSIGKNTTIKSGTYIEGNAVIGENCTIGPNCYLRDFAVIGNNCILGNAVEVCRSVIGEHVNAKHLSYIGDSIIGDNCNIGGGTIVANTRHDDQPIKTMINNSLVDTKRQKFGTVIGENAKLGIHTSIYPGRKIYNGASTLPGQVVQKDITE